jgi:hypothetical protein
VEGTPCDDGDPCTADETCHEGACAGGAAGAELTDTRFTLAPLTSGTRLTATGTFWTAGAVDPALTGATIEIWSRTGIMLYGGSVPGSEFGTNRLRTSFWYTSLLDPPPASGGLWRFSVTGRSGTVAINLRASGGEVDEVLAEALQTGELTWALRFGEECARGIGISCEDSRTGIVICR